MAYRVFLSSTSADLVAFRDAVHQAIDQLDGFTLVRMEDFGARDTDALSLDTEALSKADLFVGLLGLRYGSSPRGDATSFSEQEYDLAASLGLPQFIFVTPDDFPVPAHLIESDAKRARQEAFRARVMSDRIVASFAKSAAVGERCHCGARQLGRGTNEDRPCLGGASRRKGGGQKTRGTCG